MGEVVCSVLFQGKQQRDLVLPDYIPVHQLVNSIVSALRLPISRDLFYELKIKEGDELRQIPGSRTLQQAFILNGSFLYLIQEKEDLRHTAFLESKGGMRFRLRENTIIGRLTPDVHVDIDLTSADLNKVVSRRHAAITHVSAHFVIKDLGSHNGTYVNDIQVRQAQSIVLHPGDEICFGSLEKGVRLKFTTPLGLTIEA
jgi:hypothetical protein